MLYSIDLFKGRNIPARSRPEGILATVVTVAVPVVIALFLFGLYFSTKVSIELRKTEIASYERKIRKFSEEMSDYQGMCLLKADYEGYLSETAIALGGQEQWSDILVAIVENMPESLVLNRLAVGEHKVKVKVPDKSDPKKKRDKIVPSRTLSMDLEGPTSSETDRAVKEFRRRLQMSSVLGPYLDDIPVSQEVGDQGDRNVMSYELKCIFKPRI